MVTTPEPKATVMLTLTSILDDLLTATVFASPKHRSARGPRRHRSTYIAA